MSCTQCNKIGSVFSTKFQSTGRDELLDGFLNVCGQLSSFSDSCASIILTYFNEIYEQLDGNLKANQMCHLPGVCSKSLDSANDGIDGPNIPCDLCKQMVQHLKELLIANTTELEFKHVLEGFCKQTVAFKDECLSIVDEYSTFIYNYLKGNLESDKFCSQVGICSSALNEAFVAPRMPLVSSQLKSVSTDKQTAGQLIINQNFDSDISVPDTIELGLKGEYCEVCEYVLHFVQEHLSEPRTEQSIKKVVFGICEKLPFHINDKCHTYIQLYGDSLINLLVQQIEPRQVSD